MHSHAATLKEITRIYALRYIQCQKNIFLEQRRQFTDTHALALRHRASWGAVEEHNNTAAEATLQQMQMLSSLKSSVPRQLEFQMMLLWVCTQVPLAEGTHLTSLRRRGREQHVPGGTAALCGVTPCPCPARQLSSPQTAPRVTRCRRTRGPLCHSRLRSGINK